MRGPGICWVWGEVGNGLRYTRERNICVISSEMESKPFTQPPKMSPAKKKINNNNNNKTSDKGRSERGQSLTI